MFCIFCVCVCGNLTTRIDILTSITSIINNLSMITILNTYTLIVSFNIILIVITILYAPK